MANFGVDVLYNLRNNMNDMLRENGIKSVTEPSKKKTVRRMIQTIQWT